MFAVLSHHVNLDQTDKVREALPEHIRTLWPADPGKRFEPAAQLIAST